MSNLTPSLPPGFRFHPTDEELIVHYLRNRAASSPSPFSIIAEVDIYKFDPWELPAKAKFGDQEWYFFTPRDRKYPNGLRPNRAAVSGYWKATGTDKPILRSSGDENIGVKKALVFYKGRPPKGLKTDWIMHEYRLAQALRNTPINLRDSSMRLDDWVLCRIYMKGNHLRSVPPLVDQEQEVSGAEDAHLPTTSSNITLQNTLQTSSSLSEFLDVADYSVLTRLLFDEKPDLPGLEHGSSSLVASTSLNQPFIGNSSNAHNSLLLQQLPQRESYVSASENYLKRHWAGYSEEGGDPLHTSKKLINNSCILTNFANQFENYPQYNLLNQHLFNQ